MASETLAYAADGLNMKGQLFLPADRTGPVPGILVFPEAFGLGEHALDKAAQLAELGYAALACDLHGEAAIVDDLASVMAIIGPLRSDPARLRARASNAMDALLARAEVDPTRIGAIGFCLGGMMALELARAGADIKAAVSFHGTLATARPALAGEIRARILVCTGADDQGIDAAARTAFEEEMRAAGPDWQMHVYGGVVHSFTDPAAAKRGMPQSLRYDAKADARSWASMKALFDEVFG